MSRAKLYDTIGARATYAVTWRTEDTADLGHAGDVCLVTGDANAVADPEPVPQAYVSVGPCQDRDGREDVPRGHASPACKPGLGRRRVGRESVAAR